MACAKFYLVDFLGGIHCEQMWNVREIMPSESIWILINAINTNTHGKKFLKIRI